jgi:hypothetical protein
MKRNAIGLMMLLAIAAAAAWPLLAQGPQRRNNGIRYHNGQIKLFTNHVYFIFYGNWANSNAPEALTRFVIGLGGSPYHNINTTYYDGTGTYASNALMWGRNIMDDYSRGATLTEADVEAIVSHSITNRQLPLDPQGLYFVIASADVDAPGLCAEVCEYHDHIANLAGVSVSYALIGDPRRCPRQCALQTTKGQPLYNTPSGDWSIDAMISMVAHNITGMITNPHGDGWFDTRGRENSDKCVNTYGATYTSANGGLANVRLNGIDYLLQQNWVNANGGSCALAYP